MSIIQIESYSIDQVAIWLQCIGLGDRAVAFRNNAIDGSMLVSLTLDDLTGNDLNLSTLQAKKVLRSIDFTQSFSLQKAAASTDLQDEIRRLQNENHELKMKLSQLQQPPVVTTATIVDCQPQPQPYNPYQHHSNHQPSYHHSTSASYNTHHSTQPHPTETNTATTQTTATTTATPSRGGGVAGATRGAVRGAAGGAATGAVKGAIVGAILPGMTAGEGAEAFAAAGAATGGMKGAFRGYRKY